MKIAIDARLILNSATGIGNYLENLIDSLLKHDKKNEYTIFLNKNISDENAIHSKLTGNYSALYIGSNSVSAKQQLVIPYYLKKIQPDIYHYPHFDLPIMQRYNSVITIHDLKYIIESSYFSEFSVFKKFYMKQFLKNSVVRAKKIITVSNNTKSDLIKFFNVSPDKILVIPLAVDGKKCASSKSKEIKNVLKERGIQKKYFLFVGQRRPHKNLVKIIEAFKIFSERNNNNYQLVVVGKEYSNYHRPEERIKELKLKNDVVLAGYIEDRWLPYFYKGAEALIFTSLYEGFGLPILEAMACEVPVITSNISSMPEVAGDAALLVNPHDSDDIARAMEEIVNNIILKNKLIEKGTRRREKFSWKKTAEQTLSVYEEIAGNGQKKKN